MKVEFKKKQPICERCNCLLSIWERIIYKKRCRHCRGQSISSYESWEISRPLLFNDDEDDYIW